MGVFKEPPAGYEEIAFNFVRENFLLKNVPFFITFEQILTNSLSVKWNTFCLNFKLYILIPNNGLPEGSKESFVNLLEFSEEKLKCKNAIVCFDKERADKNSLIKTFMFLGFSLINKGPQYSDKVFMSYEI